MALTQLIDVLKVGFMISYVGPLVFILAVNMLKEGTDDY